jgi:hypothetical protein
MGRRLTPDGGNNKKKYRQVMLYAEGITIRYRWVICGAYAEYLNGNERNISVFPFWRTKSERKNILCNFLVA